MEATARNPTQSAVTPCRKAHPPILRAMSGTTPRGVLVPTLLTVSLLCNVVALIIPFLTIEVILSATESYSLLTSVYLLWTNGMHLLAALVAGFSVCFPFAKLAIMAWVWSGHGDHDARERWLHRVGAWGHWSMLDVFLVALLLTLTNDRLFVDAQPQIGIACFVAAILISMAAGEILHARSPTSEPAPRSRHTGVLVAILIVAGLGLAAAQVLPLLRVRSGIMADGDFGLYHLVPALVESGAPVLGILVAVGLIAVPWFALFTGLRLALSPSSGSLRRHAALQRWSMLDVFLVALAIFILEGKAFVPAETRSGAFVLVAALALTSVASWLARLWSRPRGATAA